MVDVTRYKKLSEIEHVRKRCEMYAGSKELTTQSRYVLDNKRFIERDVTYCPVLLKMFDEIVTNSADAHVRDGKVRMINVSISPVLGEITVEDDGGIPVEKHPEYDTWVPEMIFGELRTGSNFDDNDREGGGVNGLGAKLTNILSQAFQVRVCDGKRVFTQKFTDGMKQRTSAAVRDATDRDKPGTKITYTPDLDYLECSLDEDNIALIEKRVWDVAACNPKIQVALNSKLIDIKKFTDYVGLYTESSPVFEANNAWEVAVAPSDDDAFHHVSFVNGVDTTNGGTHVNDVVDQIVAGVRAYIKKKHKIDIKPNNIKQQLSVFINARIHSPSFTPQTKETLTTEPRNFGNRFEVNDKFMRKILKSEVVKSVLNWAEGERKRQELQELKKVNKEAQKNNILKKIPKFDDATSKDRGQCTLYLAEGDAAAKPLLSARDPKHHAVFALGGKPVNVRNVSPKKLAQTEEFQHILAILGLQVGREHTIEDVRFGRVVVASDFDPDGAHIMGLVVNMINYFWPNLVKEGIIHRLITPLFKAKANKQEFEFFSRREYETWAKENPKHQSKYYKGLGSWETKDFKRFLTNEEKYLAQLTVESEDDTLALDLVFDKDKAEERKNWLQVAN